MARRGIIYPLEHLGVDPATASRKHCQALAMKEVCMKEAHRPDMAALWKNFALAEEPEAAKAPAVSIGTVHGSVLSIVTNLLAPI